MTNKKAILGISIAAIAAIIATPAIAEAVTNLQSGTITFKDGSLKEIVFQATGALDTVNANGYGVLTEDGDLLAVTYHPGIYDSQGQKKPINSEMISNTFSVACAAEVADGRCGPEWHTHLFNADEQLQCTSGVEITRLTWHEPFARVVVDEDAHTVTLVQLKEDKTTYKESVTGEDQPFQFGTVVANQPLHQFNLTLENGHVCVNNLASPVNAVVTGLS